MKLSGWIKIILILFILMFLVAGGLFGFPWERIKAAAAIKQYVHETYGLTPTKVAASFTPDSTAGVGIVSTEELAFNFSVNILRESLVVCDDTYLDNLVEYHLAKFIKKEVGTLDNNEDIRVVLETTFSKASSDLTIEQVNSNPNVIFKLPDIQYFCSVDGIKAGSERSYAVFKEIVEHLRPTCIYFDFYNEENKKDRGCIKSDDFKSINSADDLLSKYKDR